MIQGFSSWNIYILFCLTTEFISLTLYLQSKTFQSCSALLLKNLSLLYQCWLVSMRCFALNNFFFFFSSGLCWCFCWYFSCTLTLVLICPFHCCYKSEFLCLVSFQGCLEFSFVCRCYVSLKKPACWTNWARILWRAAWPESHFVGLRLSSSWDTSQTTYKNSPVLLLSRVQTLYEDCIFIPPFVSSLAAYLSLYLSGENPLKNAFRMLSLSINTQTAIR